MIEEDKIKKCLKELINSKDDLYSYVSPKGLKELRINIAKYLENKLNSNIIDSNIIITSGSQQSIYILSRILINNNDTIISEEPTYFGAIEVFKKIGCNILTVSIDNEGIDIKKLIKLTKENNIKFIYVVPTFNNPTGTSWPNDNRKEFLKIINTHNITVIEDDPYSEFSYSQQNYKSLYELNSGKNIIYLGTFSKIICPSLSVGYIVSNKENIDKLYEYKLLNDMNTSMFIQRFVNLYLSKYNIHEDILVKVKIYKENIKKIKRELLNINKEIVFSEVKGGLYMTAYVPNVKINSNIYNESYFNSESRNTIKINIANYDINNIVNKITNIDN